MNRLTACLILMSLCTPIWADSSKFQPKGYVQNSDGEKCWYTQRVETQSKYFNESLTNTIGVMTFDDAGCMSGTGFELDINKMMINNVIARWYSHSDAAFKTKVADLYKGSLLQTRGRCIQSATYAGIGIAVDYKISNNHVVEVRHGPTVQGCTN